MTIYAQAADGSGGYYQQTNAPDQATHRLTTSCLGRADPVAYRAGSQAKLYCKINRCRCAHRGWPTDVLPTQVLDRRPHTVNPLPRLPPPAYADRRRLKSSEAR